VVSGRSGERRLASRCGAAAALLGLLGWIGWVSGITFLASLRPGYNAIAPSAATALIVLGAILMRLPRAGRRECLSSAVMAAFLSLYGLLEPLGLVFRADLNGEDAATRWLARVTSIPFEPMSPVAGAMMFAVGAALLPVLLQSCLGDRQRRLRHAGATLGSAGVVAGLVFLLGYLHHAPLLYGTGYIPIAATSALGFTLLCLGAVALAGAEAWPARLFVGVSARSRLLRTFVPLTALVVVLVSLITEAMWRAERVSHALVASALAMACALLAGLVVSRVAGALGGTIDRAHLEQELRAEVAERMTAEINHRMKNNLMLIAGVLEMQLASYPGNHPAAEELRNAIARITSLSVVHEHLYEGRSGDIELGDVLRRIGSIAVQALSAAEVDFTVSSEPHYVSPKLGSTLAILANELLTNALKHGAPAADGRLVVRVAVRHTDGSLRLRVWNSGNPVPADFDAGAHAGFGLQILHGVVTQQMKGTFSLTPHQGGTLAEVVVGEAACRHEDPVAYSGR